jgi:hypothetical protein
MAHAPYIREKARTLRIDRGLTIDELAERLALPRSTIYHWVRDLPIPTSGAGGGWPESARRKGTKGMQRKYRLLRQEAYREGLASFDELAGSPAFRDFVCLYVAEGYKRNRNVVALGNSDPAVVGLATRWIRFLSSRPLAFAIQYHADQDPVDLRNFWGGVVQSDPAAIRLQRKSNSGRLRGRTWRSRHGVLEVRASDTVARATLQAWMDRLRSDWQ